MWALALGEEEERQLGRLMQQSSLGTLAPGAERGQRGMERGGGYVENSF